MFLCFPFLFLYFILSTTVFFFFFFFFFNDTATTEIYTLSLHDALPILAAAFYLTAKLSVLRDGRDQRIIRGLFAVAGSSFLGLLIWFEVPELWQPLAFIVFAVILSEAARALRYHALAWHSHLLTGLAIFAALTVDQSAIHIWHTIPVRALSALPVVVGGYWIAKRLGTTDERHLALGRVAYAWAATGMMVWVLQDALRAPWIAVGWIVFAVVL